MEEERSNNKGFDMVDKVSIPLEVSSFSESAEYLGNFGIAEITLGYIFVSITNQANSGDHNQGQ